MKKLLPILFIFFSFSSKGTIHQIQVWNGYYQFLPSNNVTVQLGDTIQWTPLDPPTKTHTITSTNIPSGAAAFNQIWQLPADTFFQYIPQVVGLYQYVCTPHVNMNMIGEFTVVSGGATYVPVNVYIINPNGCPYTIAETWGNPILGAGNATWVSTDSLTGQDLLHFLVPDTNNQTLFTICAVPAPPCTCPQVCSGPISIFPNMALTLALCQPSDIEAIQTTNSRKVVKVTDLLGRATKATNQLLFYIYNDGTVEKKVIIE